MWTVTHDEEFTNNSIAIVVARQTLSLMPGTALTITGVLEQAVALTSAANNTASQAETIVAMKSAEMVVERTNSEMVAYNSTLARDASVVTQIEASMYRVKNPSNFFTSPQKP